MKPILRTARQASSATFLVPVLVFLGGSLAAQAGNRPECNSNCGGSGQTACLITDCVPSCDRFLQERLEGCGSLCTQSVCRSAGCGSTDERACVPFVDHGWPDVCRSGNYNAAGTCRALDADGFPTVCGDQNERACRLDEHVPSCKTDLVEVLRTSGSFCRRIDSDGYPSHCGDTGEPACQVTEKIPSCKASDDFELAGVCTATDADGYPEFCGDPQEPACTIDQQVLLGISACKDGGFNDLGTCKALDGDGYPVTCGDLNETPCKLDDQIQLGITSCKPRLEEDFALGICLDACGGNGLPACLTGCDAGLSLQFDDVVDTVVVCGAPPVDWGESDAAEAEPHGPRVVFFIHGRGGDLAGFETNELLVQLAFASANVVELYGVDWNNEPGSLVEVDPRRVRIRRLAGTEAAPQWNTVQSYGRREITANDFQIFDVAQAMAEAIRDLEITTPITIVTYSYGAVIARQLVYRHYDELRAAGHDIVEVMTMQGPHRGGLIGTPDLTASGGVTGLDLQTDFACVTGRLAGAFGMGSGQDGCQLGRWVQWALDKGIDDTNYPQIRWIAVAGGGHRIGEDAIDVVLTAPAILDPRFRTMLENEADPEHTPFLDSDETVPTRSAFGIALDACYPYVRTTPPGSGATTASVVFDTYTWEGQEALSATCYHAAAASPSAPATRPAAKHDLAAAADERSFAFDAIALPAPEPGAGRAGVIAALALTGLARRRRVQRSPACAQAPRPRA